MLNFLTVVLVLGYVALLYSLAFLVEQILPGVWTKGEWRITPQRRPFTEA